MWKPVCEAWFSVAPNVMEEFNISMQGELQILLKQREIQRNTDFMRRRALLLCFLWNVFKVCYCVIHWNIFDTYIQLLPHYTLIWFIEAK